ncbi:MAG: TolC family protein [Arenicella sp.]|nr:TolC family protein [Arenicella sp.]
MHHLLLIVALTVSGCATQIKQLPEEAKVAIPSQWETGPEQNTDKPAVAETVPGVVNNGWLQTFTDDELIGHVETALVNNPDLLSSAAQLKAAIEQVTINGASLWPNIQANLSRNRTDNDSGGISTEIRTVSGALDISWEADVWGKLTQRKKSAAYTAQAQGELFKAAELSLVANVSRAWYNLVTNKLQLDLAFQRLDSFQRTATLIDENYKRGLRSALDVYLSRTDVQLQVSALKASEFSYIRSLRAFKKLLGEYPDTDLEFTAKLPILDGSVPSGLPAELLTRRPDLRASQLQYQAQIATAKAAYRDRFPSISFAGSIGDSRDSFNQLFENDNMITTLISGVTQPLFLAGALKSRQDQALYQAETAYASLLKTTLTAFEEVENSLSRESLLRERHRATAAAVEFAQNGLDLALDRYQSGIENYTTVLESQRRLFNSMASELNIRNALLQNRIDIHLALGGDFSNIADRNATADLPDISEQGIN